MKLNELFAKEILIRLTENETGFTSFTSTVRYGKLLSRLRTFEFPAPRLHDAVVHMDRVPARPISRREIG
jgi:hypothetical protein